MRVCLNNVPYAVMFVLGSAVLFLSFADSVWRWIAPLLYLGYGAGGALWVMLFVCPYCAAHGSPACPSGHGVIAAMLRSRQRGGDFGRQFRRHIPVIIPFWFIPLIVGGVHLFGNFSWGFLVLVVAFGVDGLAVVPILSRRHGCAYCPQRATCPWMHGPAKGQ